MANHFKGEVPFPAAGEGIVVRFTMADLAELATRYNNPHHHGIDQDKSFWTTIMQGVMTSNPVVTMDCLRIGLKKAGTTNRLSQEYLEDPPFSLEDAAAPLADALTLRRDGKPWSEQVKEIAERMAREKAEMEGGADPQPPMQTEAESPASPGSSASATEPA